MQYLDPCEEIVTHLPAMRAFAVSLARNQALAEDILQDAVIKAWTNFDKFRQGTILRAWLFTILRNGFFSFRRRTKHEIEDIDGLFAGSWRPNPSTKDGCDSANFCMPFAS